MSKPNLRTPADFGRLENYIDSVDPAKQPLLRIITRYQLSEDFACGLAGCRQPHRSGFLVELEGKSVTNVGHICGERFGEKFSAEQKRYAEQEIRPRAIKAIQSVVQTIAGIRDELDHMRSAAALLSQQKQGLRTLLPGFYQELQRRANTNNDRVSEQVERSQKEIDELMALTPGARRESFRYREEDRGVIPGLRVLAVNIQEKIVTEIVAKAEELSALDATSLSTERLVAWENWASGFAEARQQAADTLAAGQRLFAPDGFKQMALAATNPADVAKLSGLTANGLLKASSKSNEDDAQRKLPGPQPTNKRQADAQKKLDAILANVARRRR